MCSERGFDPATQLRLVRYKAMQASFEKSGFSELFEDTDRLDKFLETHRQARKALLLRNAMCDSTVVPGMSGVQVRSSFQAAGFENLLDDAAAAGHHRFLI